MSGHAISKAARDIRSELAPHWGRMGSFQWGTVNAVNLSTAPPTVDVYLDGSTTLTTGFCFLSTYNPKVGDVVVVGRMQGPAQTARFVMPPLAQSSMVNGSPILVAEIAPLTTSQATLDFQNFPLIPGTRKLIVELIASRGTASNTLVDVILRLNNDSTNAYYTQRIWWNSNAESDTDTAVSGIYFTQSPAGTSPAHAYGGGSVTVWDYQSSHFKECWGQGSGPSAQTSFTTGVEYVQITAGSYTSTNQITRATLVCSSGSFDVGSCARLYEQ